MLTGIKQRISRIPAVDRMKKQTEKRLAGNRLIAANGAIDSRLQEKRKTGEKIHVVFVCHRPAVWGALRSVYDAIKEDDRFCVSFVAIPSKKLLPDLGLDHEIYESEGAEEFWKDCGCINGYDYYTGKWLDLKTLNPDYIFFQQPYNSMLCREYASGIVSQYAKLCYVSYFAACKYGDLYDESLPLDFLRDVSFYFSQNTVDDRFVRNRVDLANGGMTKVCLTGYPKYDYARQYAASGLEAKRKDHQFGIIWTPRWTTNEGLCHFFDYKDKLVEYCLDNPTVDLIFRPHPQAFLEWERTGELPEKEREAYLRIFDQNSHLHVDQSKNYYPLLYASNCLVTDMSSIVFDYMLTGNPVILCMDQDKDGFYEDIGDGLYRVSTWDELSDTLSMLVGGEDPLYDMRQRIVRERMNITDEGAGVKIARILAEDAFGVNER